MNNQAQTRPPLYLLLNHRLYGYLIRWFFEFIPLGPWAIGDVLGFIDGLIDYRQVSKAKGMLKMVLAAIPGIPTIPLHYVIDTLWRPRPQTVVPVRGTPHNPEIGVILNP